MSGSSTRRHVIVALISAAALLALAGCSNGDKKPSAAPPAKPGALHPAGNAADGYTVSVPDSWTDIAIDANALETLFNSDKGSKLDEAIKSQIRLLAGRGGKLFAFDPALRTTNLNVLKSDSTPGLTLDALAKGLPAQLNELHLENVKVETVNLASGPAVKATGTQPGSTIGQNARNLLQIQYYVINKADTFVLVLASDDPTRDTATLESIGQTFSVPKK